MIVMLINAPTCTLMCSSSSSGGASGRRSDAMYVSSKIWKVRLLRWIFYISDETKCHQYRSWNHSALRLWWLIGMLSQIFVDQPPAQMECRHWGEETSHRLWPQFPRQFLLLHQVFHTRWNCPAQSQYFCPRATLSGHPNLRIKERITFIAEQQ